MLTDAQKLKLIEKITEEPSITHIEVEPYAPEKDGTQKFSVCIYGPTSDGDPNGLISDEAI